MTKRKIIGFMTILGGIPGVGGLLHFMNDIGEVSLGFVLIVLAVFCRGICGVVGGVLLWRGNKLGYQLSIVMWGYMVIVGLLAFYQIFTDPHFTSFEFSPENSVFWSVIGKSAGKLIWGIPFLYILTRDLLALKKNSTEGVGLRNG